MNKFGYMFYASAIGYNVVLKNRHMPHSKILVVKDVNLNYIGVYKTLQDRKRLLRVKCSDTGYIYNL